MAEPAGFRRFELVRRTDVTGVSGEGLVAEGVVFSDGHAAIHWTGSKRPTTTPHPDGVESVLDVHGHDGETTVEWLDNDPAATASAWAKYWQGRARQAEALEQRVRLELTNARAERDALKAAIAEVRRLCDLTISASCRRDAIDQAHDTLAVLDRALGASGADHD